MAVSFGDALKNAGIIPSEQEGYDKKKVRSFTLEMKLHEMIEHVMALERLYQKYLNAEGQDQFDYIDSLANRYGYMVIAFQDIVMTICKLKIIKSSENISIRRAIAEFQGIFETECQQQRLDDAISSFADRNEIVHVYENYRDNMETILSNVQNYRKEYETIYHLLLEYCKKEKILNNE